MTPQSSPWIRNPVWDTALLALPWAPFYLWFVYGLRLGEGGGEVLVFGERTWALTLATFVVLAITYVHRHYTFVLVYGDPQTFSANARAYLVAPLVLFGALWLARSDVTLVTLGRLRVSAWQIALVTSGTWNVWHTVQQRYGIFRVYAGKAGGGLESRAHARRDQLLTWSLVVAVALVLLVFRRSTFLGHESAQQALAVALPIVTSPMFMLLAAVLSIGVLTVVIGWVRAEIAAPLTLRQRVPRLTFLASTLALFAVFVVHGPIVGYLTFGTAHALEYLAFVHHFGERKFAARPDARSVAAMLLRRPIVVAPLLAGGLLLLYVGLQPVADTEVYWVYYLGTSMLHFLYDGWIWKVRKPEVAQPLGARAATA